MNTIKFYKIRPFEFTEIVHRKKLNKWGEEYIARETIIHKVKGDIAKLNNEIYFGFTLDIPPNAPDKPASEFESKEPEHSTDAECLDYRFYLRKGSMRTKSEDGVEIEYYQPHVKDFFNRGGLTYIKFDSSFAHGKFEKEAKKIQDRMKSVNRNNTYYEDAVNEFLADLSWL